MTSNLFSAARWVVLLAILALSPNVWSVDVEPASVACDCEAVACGPCEVEAGVNFYTAKCGPNFERVKSCKKPTCAPVENQNKCLVQRGLSPIGKPQNPVERAPAAAAVAAPQRAGVVEISEGVCSLTRASGPIEVPREGVAVFAGDVIETKANGKVRVHLNDGSALTIAVNSRVEIAQMQVDDKGGHRAVLLDLIRGKVRSQVAKKYDSDNTYVIRTKTAVAGVRGTDFVVSFEENPTSLISEVHTFEGRVRFDRLPGPDGESPVDVDSGHTSASAKGVDVPVGTHASLTTGIPEKADGDSALALAKVIRHGSLSPLMRMKEDEIHELKDATDFVEATDAVPEVSASATVNVARNRDGDQVCSDPAGQYNQCSFSCEGNPKGEKHCRLDLPGVACIRRLCRANGLWSEPSRLPPAEASHCQVKVVVGDCGSYW